MKKRLLWILPVLCAALLLALPALADEVDVTFDLTYEYGLARTAYQLTNEFRTGDNAWYWNNDNTTTTDLTGTLGALSYDYGLERAAMRRAAEIAVFFEHTRPDGSGWSTVHANTHGENIAAGYGSAEAVVTGWREDDYDYSGQGHRRNMLGANFTTIGVGCVRAGGKLYWVQEFGWSASGESASSLTGPVTITVDTDVLGASNIKSVYADPSDIPLQKGGRAGLPRVIACLGWGRNPVTVNGVGWEAADPAVADVDGTGIVANALGTTTVSAIAFDKIATAKITVLTWPGTITAEGGVFDLSTLDGFDVSKASGWSGAAVNGNFLIVKADGKVTYRYAMSADDTLDLFFDVTVTNADIADCTVEVDAKDLTYTGEAAEPKVKVTRTVGDTALTLTEGTDYTLAYADNVNAGTARVTVTGAGLYNGEKAASFVIGARDLKKNVKVTLEKKSMTYTGKALEPKVTVTDTVNGETVTLKKDKDYTVTYKNNIIAGTATVTVKGKGNYTGTATKTFTIMKVKLTPNLVTLKYTKTAWTGKALKPAVTVKAKVNGKLVTLKKGTDYTVTYKNNKPVGTAAVTVTGKGNFSGTISKNFAITKVKLKSADLEFTKAAWTGKAIKPKVTVKAKVNGKTVTLKKGTDYTVTYKDNINKGTATVTIKGKGNYTGTITKTFTIK